jgi:hypothetical protein
MKSTVPKGVRALVEIIGEWTGKVVVVVLRVGGGMSAHKQATLEGKLVQVAASGILLELPKDRTFAPPSGLTFVPVSAILSVSLAEARV